MAGFDENRFADVIDRFHEAAFAPDLWRDTLQDFSEALGATCTVFVAEPGARIAPVCSEGMDEAAAHGAREGLFENNPCMVRGMALMRRPEDAITDRMCFSPEEVNDFRFNTEVLEAHGLRHWMGFVAAFGKNASIAISAVRRTVDEPFDAADIAALRRIAPLLQRAGRIAREFGDARAEGQLAAFEAMGKAALLLDGRGRAVRLNAPAEALIGRGLDLARGHPAAPTAEGTRALRALAHAVTRQVLPHALPAPGQAAIPRPGHAPLIAHAAPVPRSASEVLARARGILVLTDPEAGQLPAEETLRAAFGLTGAEARVALALARGLDPAAIAALHGVSGGTVRGQLKAVYGKTGTARQAALVALVAGLSGPEFPPGG